MRTSTQVALLQLVETLVRAIAGLILGFIGFIAVLTAFYQLANVNFNLLSGLGASFALSLALVGLLLWFAGKLLKSLIRRGQSV